MTNRFNITAITTYKDGDGNERKSYARCGTAFINETRDGEQVINLKFDFQPVGPDVEIACFKPKPKDEGGDVIE